MWPIREEEVKKGRMARSFAPKMEVRRGVTSHQPIL
jgi:hypothetical protein